MAKGPAAVWPPKIVGGPVGCGCPPAAFNGDSCGVAMLKLSAPENTPAWSRKGTLEVVEVAEVVVAVVAAVADAALISSFTISSSRLPSSTMSWSMVLNFRSNSSMSVAVRALSSTNSSWTPAMVLRRAISTWPTPACMPAMTSSTS